MTSETSMETNYKAVPNNPPHATVQPTRPTGRLGAHVIKEKNDGVSVELCTLMVCYFSAVLAYGLYITNNCAIKSCSERTWQWIRVLLNIGATGAIIPIGLLIGKCIMRR